MRRMRRYLTALLALLLTLSLAGCSGSNEGGGASSRPPVGETSPAAQGSADDFQKNLHQTDELFFLETEEGYYFSWGSLFYIDKANGNTTRVCGKPDCDHTTEDCNSRIRADYLLGQGDGGPIYYVGVQTDPKQVWSVSYDAAQREPVQELKFRETSAAQSCYDIGIYHRGYLYYVSDDILYRVQLGGEKDSAEELWRPENAGSAQSNGGMIELDPNAIRYTLWADGDKLYFMANVQTAQGTKKDVLYQCGLDGSDVHQVWATPDADEVGEWERTGVSVSQWYITDGSIYFYLSGNDYWRTDLSTGKTEKLADTHEQTQYGSAVFNDASMCLLGETPGDRSANATNESLIRRGGDAIYLYDLDGTYRREISLEKLTEKVGDNLEIALLMVDSAHVYFQVTTTSYSTQNGFPVGNVGSETLWRANLETGEVSQLYQLR